MCFFKHIVAMDVAKKETAPLEYRAIYGHLYWGQGGHGCTVNGSITGLPVDASIVASSRSKDGCVARTHDVLNSSTCTHTQLPE